MTACQFLLICISAIIIRPRDCSIYRNCAALLVRVDKHESYICHGDEVHPFAYTRLLIVHVR